MNPHRWRNHTSVISPKRKRGLLSRLRLRFGLVGLLLLLPAAAQAQSELNKPYNLHIVVYVADNRLLTDVFRERIERQLHDGFQAALGNMARVTVSHKHPRLDDVLARGLKQALDGWTDRDDIKTHFVFLDYSGVHYEIQTRQYDGTIGRASPVVRRDRTRDRDFVAKAAALLIKQDFGVLGTVMTAPEGAKEQVQVELRGGGLGDLSRWVKKGEVFALAPPGGGSLRALDWSFLQVEEPPAQDARNGVCLCCFFHRYRVPSIAGYRCIKLGTVQAPLRLRWIRKVPGTLNHKPLDLPITVDIHRYGFDGEEATGLHNKSVDRNGVLETVSDGDRGVFRNVAFVRVTGGIDGPKPRVPIALVDDQPIFIEIDNASTDVDILFSVQKANWRNNVADCLQIQANLFKRLETLGAKAENRQQIIREAEAGLEYSRTARASLLREKKDLVKKARNKHEDLKTQREEKRLTEIKEGEKTLENFIKEQKKIEETENDPQRKKWLSEIQSAKLLEQQLEIGQAIAIYERIQKEGYDDPDAELAKHLKELHQLWDPKNAEHKEARGFIYRVWPTLELSRLKDKIPTARKAFETCQDAGDLFSIQKLLKGTEGHADQLRKALAELNPESVIGHAEQAKRFTELSDQIVKLGMDIQDDLKTRGPEK